MVVHVTFPSAPNKGRPEDTSHPNVERFSATRLRTWVVYPQAFRGERESARCAFVGFSQMGLAFFFSGVVPFLVVREPTAQPSSHCSGVRFQTKRKPHGFHGSTWVCLKMGSPKIVSLAVGFQPTKGTEPQGNSTNNVSK